MADNDVCAVAHIHPDGVNRARAAVPAARHVNDLAMLFGAFSDPTRIRLLTALATGPLCVCDLAAVLSMKQPAISHQLRLLRNIGLVRTRREGKLVWYALDDDHVRDLLAVGAAHVTHREPQRDMIAQSA